MRLYLLLLLLLLAAPAHAQDSPGQCTAAGEGSLACLAGRACVCRFERGGQLTGRGDRFAWDCGPLRPECPATPAVPAPAPDLQVIAPMERRR
ncbi:hypothetical protein [Plastoroseomonas arctica]|uniref:Secreted protein n=1 Tax=Plastoroseomonas arctica TaxID=1509237 RepID=A0AAF1KQ51_9PROT|nr:hypothetical protein [Plastoroseomonas arctica]MBR0657088.1 hypothetical protein [Plastoroseomonas arctica]